MFPPHGIEAQRATQTHTLALCGGLIPMTVDVNDPNHQRVSQLEREVHQLGAEIHGLARGQSELSATQRAQGERLERIGEGVDRLIEERAHKPPIWNTSAVIALVGTCIAFVWGVSSYVDIRTDALKGSDAALEHRLERFLDDLDEWMDDKDNFQRETHYEVAQLHGLKKEYNYKLQHFDELDHVRDDRLNELEKKAAAAEVSRRAIGDYLKELAAKVEKKH